jgi:hypothetical protein
MSVVDNGSYNRLTLRKGVEMKLSEAIREGAKARPQAKGAFFKRAGRNKTLCSCALGAAYEGATGRALVGKSKVVMKELVGFFPQLEDTVPEGFLNGGTSLSAAEWKLAQLISVTNDRRGATREEIADGLEAQGL